MANDEAKLNIKLTQLKLSAQRTAKILDSGKRETIERQLNALKTTINEADNFKRAVEAAKIEREDDLEEISDWNAEIETKISEAEDEINKLQHWLINRKLEEENHAREEQLRFEVKLQETKAQVNAKIQNSKSGDSKISDEGMSVRLPKINITKFEGEYMDWPRFWGQFTETVDKSNIAAINKFTYLCGFLGPKVKRRVESLPFTTEGYNRAKSILKDQYGKNSEIIKAYIKEIMDLPHISGANPRKIAEFSEKLNHSVQALETLGKLKDVQGNVSMTLDKLPAIHGDLVRNDPEWESWDFSKLTEAVRQWTRRNPVCEKESDTPGWKSRRSEKVFHTKEKGMCVYCEGNHKSGECKVISTVKERRAILVKKKLCFNCTAGQHHANACPSKSSCRNCHKRHHTSICDVTNREEPPKTGQTVLTTDGCTGEGIFPILVVKINGITCRALIDSGAGSSYISGKLASMLRVKPIETQTTKVDMLLTSKQQDWKSMKGKLKQ
ncbi:uncharacterized protein LOC124459129 [Xenia sp. Carnegie-2017]|uniref:uncharacterized protein LOC124459129 n=1 Tax=Xenia sp. Carnegie-2017 TaxID=2897299 RepID=UPI001F0457CE|nr:uncharacterized protein LOC124459129 [Xenia sp. Carnegie-2017]